ncbi:MAG: hypothetical protein KGH61_00655 [Candidatus Micrarchaeota archaeon]|nr:hypothetical protein [Candidatus Micrarchaeota archaeon]MDE1847446.1 hypothetical protein [Candidatus Micrarchaeota archaeon]MDE1864059.1 hypothetical protein [Candidatus Micrarchaeota archaeon]
MIRSRKARNLEILGEGASIRRDSNPVKFTSIKVDLGLGSDIKPLVRSRDEKFWESEAGFEEALRLIGGYLQRNNVLPRVKEAESELGLRKFVELLGYGAFLEKRDVATWGELLKKYFQGMQAKRVEHYSEEWWKSKAGFEEAKKRVLEFWSKTGTIPSEKRVRFIGVTTFHRLLKQGFWKESKGVESWEGFISMHCGLVREEKAEKFWKSDAGFEKAIALITDFGKKHMDRMPSMEERRELGLEEFGKALKNGNFEEKFGLISWQGLFSKYFGDSELRNLWNSEEGFSIALEKATKFFKSHGRKPTTSEIRDSGLNGFAGAIARYEWLGRKDIVSMTEFYDKYVLGREKGVD